MKKKNYWVKTDHFFEEAIKSTEILRHFSFRQPTSWLSIYSKYILNSSVFSVWCAFIIYFKMSPRWHGGRKKLGPGGCSLRAPHYVYYLTWLDLTWHSGEDIRVRGCSLRVSEYFALYMMMMMSHTETVIRLPVVFHPYCIYDCSHTSLDLIAYPVLHCTPPDR